jgi:hypothetical protein
VLTNNQYIRLSLEFNLFFLRIAKEHAIFAAASLPPRDRAVAQQLLVLKNNFERLLSRAVALSNGIISEEVLTSGELVTEFTLPAENATQFLTGLPINTSITKQELDLVAKGTQRQDEDLLDEVSDLNQEALELLTVAINLQVKLLRDVLNCKAFSYTYPLMLDHVTREARFAAITLTKLQNRDTIDSVQEIIQFEINWNRIMGEHSKFIRGYLDPSENALFEKSNSFAKEFDALLAQTLRLEENPGLLPQITRESIQRVTELRNFKVQGTQGILACKVKSIIPPLLSDHVLREANHYLRLLRTFSRMS